jgi:CheY-like chemotaxis protein
MRALVIEDELKTAAYLRQGLSESGFVVEVCHNGEDGLHQALTVNNDLIILDVMLPKRDGWSVLASLRQAGEQTPVLFLTARDQVQERVKGLELGADDYLIKPFDFSELLARVRTILRRGAGAAIRSAASGRPAIGHAAAQSHAQWGPTGFDRKRVCFAGGGLCARRACQVIGSIHRRRSGQCHDGWSCFMSRPLRLCWCWPPVTCTGLKSPTWLERIRTFWPPSFKIAAGSYSNNPRTRPCWPTKCKSSQPPV